MIKFLRSKLVMIITFLAVILLLIFFHQLNLLKPIKNVFTAIFEPVQKPLSTAGYKINNFFGYFNSLKSLKEENIKLKDEISKLILENNNLKTSLNETEILRSELEFVKKYNYRYLAAQVIGRSPDNLQVLIINKGEVDRIKNDLPVIVNDGILIGKIIQTQKTTAKILLLTDSHSLISASIENKEKSQGVVKGEHGLSLKMDLIPQDHEVKEGQLVVTSGLESNIPVNLVIGQINQILVKKGELFKQATLTPAASFNNLQIITVIIL